MALSLDTQRAPLTPAEEELFAHIRARIEAYFLAFEELEGFSVLRSNLDRLLRKVVLELRCVCYEYHDSFLVLEALRDENERLRDDAFRYDTLREDVMAEVERAKARFQTMDKAHQQALDDLHAFYVTQESLWYKQWAVEADTKQQQAMDRVLQGHEAKLALLRLEYEQRQDATKKQLESKHAAELEYTEVQLRLQITSQVSRDLGKKLARQEKLCEKHTSEMKQLQRRVASLQEALKARSNMRPTERLQLHPLIVPPRALNPAMVNAGGLRRKSVWAKTSASCALSPWSKPTMEILLESALCPPDTATIEVQVEANRIIVAWLEVADFVTGMPVLPDRLRYTSTSRNVRDANIAVAALLTVITNPGPKYPAIHAISYNVVHLPRAEYVARGIGDGPVADARPIRGDKTRENT